MRKYEIMFIVKPDLEETAIKSVANDMKSAGNVGGYFNGNIIVSHNSPTTFSTLSPEAIRFDTFHEAAHRLYELLRINPDVQTGNYVTGYYMSKPYLKVIIHVSL